MNEPAAPVLVVDDESANLSTFRRVFRADLPGLLLAGSGEAALRVLTEQPGVGLVIADFSMPDMDGVQLLRRVRELHPRPRRAILTAYGDLPELTEALATGVCEVIFSKPWDHADLLAGIQALLFGGKT